LFPFSDKISELRKKYLGKKYKRIIMLSTKCWKQNESGETGNAF
jgi:hypothetical protein